MNQPDEIRGISGRSRSQTITGIGLFAALALALNLSHIQVPAPYAPYLIYEFWEIPIVACLLIFGLYASLAASAVNTVVLIAVNPGSLASGPIYNFIAVVVTLGAIVVTHKLNTRLRYRISFEMIFATGLAILMRTAVMTVVNYELLPFPAPLGFNFPIRAVLAALPFIAIFNATLALYTVPIGFAAVKSVSRRLHFKLAYPLSPVIVKN